MDPPFGAASVVAPLQITGTTAHAFIDLRAIYNTLPGRFHALSDEVFDLELVLREVAHIAKDRGNDPLFTTRTYNVGHLLRKLTQSFMKIKQS